MSKIGYTIANAQGFFLKHEAERETEEDIKAHVATKMEIIDDFLVGKKRLKGDNRTKFEDHLLSLGSILAIDNYFRDYINKHM